ncbi:hypothetical protein Tco_1111493 [Tanacetum coccineum]|uniref:Uncharacterized protein n=1 Tax=Tanacetum coccineum TaxID=301880 RepID=A0ABQ5ILT2_9ASTR
MDQENLRSLGESTSDCGYSYKKDPKIIREDAWIDSDEGDHKEINKSRPMAFGSQEACHECYLQPDFWVADNESTKDITGSKKAFTSHKMCEYRQAERMNQERIIGKDVAQTESQEEVIVSKVSDDHVVNESDTHVDVETAVIGRTEEPVVEHVIVDELYMVVVRNLLNRVMMRNLLNMIVANKSNMMLTGSIVVRIIKVSIIIL